MGWSFPPPRWADLQRGVAAVAGELGMDDLVECIERLLSGPLDQRQHDALAHHLTVGETYFFRESPGFELLARRILPAMIHLERGRRRELRMWSAGCCTGEEAYSIAISLVEAIADWRDWKITLLATDINPRFLRKAEAGVFGPWSFRGAPARLKERYFRAAANDRFEIQPEIRRLVRFEQLNLMDDVYPSAANDAHDMDVIFCRNVLMYFTAAQAAKVVRNLHRAQSQDGWLIVSPSDSPQVLSPPYRKVNLDGAIVHQKTSQVEVAATPAAMPKSDTAAGIAVMAALASAARPSAPAKRPDPVEQAVDPYVQSEALYAQGRYEEAARILSGVLAARPNSAAALGLLAHCLANQRKLPDAMKRCEEWVVTDKMNPASHYLRSVVMQEHGSAEAAVQSLLKAVYLDPGFALAHFALGNIARARGRFPEAEKHMNNALRSLGKLSPGHVLPESDGITAGRLAHIIENLNGVEATA